MHAGALNQRRVRWAHLAILLAVVAPIYGWGLSHYPLVGLDDAWFAEAGWELIARGRFVVPLYIGVTGSQVEGVERVNYGVWPLNGLVAAIPFSLFGTSIVALRATTVLCGLGAVVLLYAAVSLWYDHMHGLLAAGALVSNPFFFVSVRGFRPEALLVLLFCAALFAVSRASGSSRSVWWLLAAGGFMGMGMAAHYNSLVLLLVILSIVLVNRWPKASWRELAVVVGGFAIGLLPLLIFIAQDIPNWLEQTHAVGDIGLKPQDFLARLIGEGRRYFHWKAMPMAIYLPVLILVMIRRGWANNMPIIATVTFIIALAALTGNKTRVYFALGTPLYAMLLAMMLADAVQKGRPSRRAATWYKIASWALVAGVALAFAALLVQAYGHREANYQRLTTAIRQHLHPGDLVVCNPELWFGLHSEHDLRSVHFLPALEAAGIRAQYVVTNDRLKQRLLKQRLTPYSLDRDFRFLATVHEPKYGDYEVWVRKSKG